MKIKKTCSSGYCLIKYLRYEHSRYNHIHVNCLFIHCCDKVTYLENDFILKFNFKTLPNI